MPKTEPAIDYAALNHAQLAVALLDLAPADPLLTQAAERLARVALERAECPCVMVNQSSVVLPKLKPFSAVRCMVGDDRVETEMVSVRWLRPGEVRAVDRFGEVIVVVRQPESRT